MRLSVVAFLAVLAACAAQAQEQRPQAAEDALATLRREAATALEEAERLMAEAQAAADLAAERRAELATAAAAARAVEADALEATIALRRLTLERRNAEAARDSAAHEARRLAAALAVVANARLGWAALAKPESAVDAARAALVVRSLSERHADEMRRHADAATALADIEARAESRRRALAAAAERAAEERARIDALADDANRRRDALDNAAQAAQARAEAAASEALTLTELLSRLTRPEEEAAPPFRVRLKAEALLERKLRGFRPRPSPRRNAPSGLPENGDLRAPVVGILATRFGDPTPSGLPARGMTLEAAAGAQIAAPAFARVLFAGPFRNYRQVVILDAGRGGHIILAGMSELYARVGDLVRPGVAIGRLETGNGPSLYLEIRVDGRPVDPLSWFRQAYAITGG